MSDVLTYFREQVDPRFKDVSDSDLTEYIYNRHPQFSKDPEFHSSVKRLFDQQAQFGTSAPDFVSDEASQRGRLSSSGQSIMRGGGVGTGGAISLFGRVMNTLAPYVAAGSDNPQARMYGFEEMQRRGTMSPAQREAEIQQDPIYQAGKAISGGASEAFQPNPKYRGEFFTDVLPSSLGGMVPTVAAGMVNPWLGVAQYAGSSGEDIAQEAIAAGRPDLANKAALIGAPIGALTEGLLGQASKLGGRMIVSRLASGGAEAGAEALAREAAKPLGRAMAETAIKEAAQEGLEQLGQNIAASDIVGYDPNRPVMQGVGESMLAGGILGVGGEAAVRGVNRAARAEYNRAVDRAFAEEDRRLSPYIERLANQYIDENPEVGRRMFVDPSRQEIIRSPMPEIAPGITAGTGAAFNPENPDVLAADLRSQINRILRRPNSLERRAALEAGMNMPQESGIPVEQSIGQYPPEGFGTGVIPSAEEQQRRAAVRAEVARRNAAAAEQARLSYATEEERAAAGTALAAQSALAPAQQTPTQSAQVNQPKNINDLRDASRSGSLEIGQSGTLDDGTEWTSRKAQSGRVVFQITRTKNNTSDYGRTWNKGYSVGDTYNLDTGNAQVVSVEPAPEGLNESNSRLVISEILGPNEVVLKRVANSEASNIIDNPSAAEIRRRQLSLQNPPSAGPEITPETQSILDRLAAGGYLGEDARRAINPSAAEIRQRQLAQQAPASPNPVITPETQAVLDRLAGGGYLGEEARRSINPTAMEIRQKQLSQQAPASPEPVVGDEARAILDRLRSQGFIPGENKAAAPAAPTLQPTVSLPTGPGAAAAGGVPAAAPAISQAPAVKQTAPAIDAVAAAEIEKLQSFIDDVELENINAPSPAKMRSLANKALKLGYIDRASIDEINRVQKSMGSREDTTDAMNELMGRLVLRLEGLQKKAAPAPISPVTQPKKFNANQKQGRVEVPRGEQSQGAPQNAAGQPGAVQEPAGKGVKAVVQAAPQVAPQGDVAKAAANKAAKAKPAPIPNQFADGTPIEENQYVRVLNSAFGPKGSKLRNEIGKTVITGEVKFDKETGRLVVVVDRVGLGKTNSAIKAGIVPQMKIPILDGSNLRLTERPQVEVKKEEESDVLTDEQRISANTTISAAMAHPRYAEFKQELATLYASKSKENADLDAIRKELGPDLSLAMEAGFNLEIGNRLVSAKGQNLDAIQLDEARNKFADSVLKWFVGNLVAPFKERVPFAAGRTADMQVANAARLRLEDRLTVTPSESEDSSARSSLEEKLDAMSADTSSSTTAESSSGFNIGGSSLDQMFGSLKNAANIILSDVAGFEKQNKNRKLDLSGLEQAVYSAIRKSASSNPLFESEATRESAELALKGVADSIAEQIIGEYSEGTLNDVRSLIEDGEIILRANTGVIDTGNQSLTEGTTTLRDAIGTVLAGENPVSPLRKIADALLRAGVNPDVVVLSDEAFNALRPGLEGQSAFYNADPAVNTVYVRQSARSHDYLVLHEAVHAATVYAIRTNGKFRFELAKLRTDAMNSLGAGSFYGLQEHGSNFKNLAEFVGEALSNQQFREALDGIKTASGQSLWARFKQLVASLFGLKAKQKSLLDAITEMSVQQFAPNVSGRMANADAALFGQSEGVQPMTGAADAAYLDLANRYDSGDESVLPELQRMVDEAAKKAGYAISRVYHASRSAFDVFLSKAEQAEQRGEELDYDGYDGGNLGTGFYFTPDRGYASRYGTPRAFYLKVNNMVDLRDASTVRRAVEIQRELEDDRGPVEPGEVYDELMQERNADGIIGVGVGGFSAGATELLVKKSSQAKLADPITRDSDGNIIPLSKRFNPESDSILFAGKVPVTAAQLAEKLKVPEAEGRAVIMAGARAAKHLVHPNVVSAAMEKIIPPATAGFINTIESESDYDKQRDLIKSLKDSGKFDYYGWLESPESKARRALSFITELSNITSEQSLPLRSMPVSTDEEVKVKGEVAHRIYDDSEKVRKKRDKLHLEINKLSAESASKTDPLNVELEELKKVDDVIAGSEKQALADYKQVLNAQKKLSKLGGVSIAQAEADMAASMAHLGSNVGRVRADLRTISEKIDSKMLAKSDLTNADIVKWVVDNNILAGSPILGDMLPSKSSNGLLMNYRRLIPTLRWISSLRSDAAAAHKVIEDYKAQVAAITGSKNRPTSLERFLSEYAKIIRHFDALMSVSGQIEKRANKIKSLQLQLGFVNDVMGSPEYKEQSEDAVKTLDIVDSAMRGSPIKERGLFVYTVGKRADGKDDRFEINAFANTKAAVQANQETYIRLINKIQNELARADITPVYRNTLEHMMADAHLMNDERIESTLWYNELDPMTHLRRLPGFRLLVPSGMADWLAQGRLGVELSVLSTSLDNIKRKVRALHSNDRIGRNAQLIAAKAAIDSHAADMPANLTDWEKSKWWEENVLNEVFDQNQDKKLNELRPGQYTSDNIKVTKEDYHAAELMARWQDKLRQIIESTKGAAGFQPTRIRETRYKIGPDGKKVPFVVERLAFAEGSLTTPVLLDRSYTSDHSGSSAIDLSSRWNAIPENDTEAKLKLLSDPKAYKKLALRHVADMSRWSEVRGSKFDEEYRSLARQWREKGSSPGSIEELIDQISESVPSQTFSDGTSETEDEKRSRVTGQLFNEITRFTDDHSTQLKDDAASMTTDPLFNMVVGKGDRGDVNIMTFMDAENSFMKPRKNAVAPPSFYSHSLFTNEAFIGLEHGSTMPLEVRRYKLIDELLGRLTAAKTELDNKIAEENRSKRGEKSGLSESTSEIVREMSKGGPISEGYNYTSYQLGQLIKTISAIKENVRGSLSVRPSIVEGRGFVNRALGLVKLQWLSTFKSLIKQCVEAIMGTRMMADMLFRGMKMRGPIRVGMHAVNVVHDLVKVVHANRKEVADFLRNNSGKLAAILNQTAHADADMIRAIAFNEDNGGGLSQELNVLKMGNDMFSRNLPSKNIAARVLDSLMSSKGMRHIEGVLKTLVQEQEKIANILSTVHFDREMTRYMRKLAKLIEVRIARGNPALLDFTKPENNFTAKELSTVGIDASTWAKQLKVLRSSQKIEEMALDFHKRQEAARAAGEDTSKLAFTNDDGIYEDVITNLSKLNNLALQTNRPEIITARTELGDLARAGTVFVGWASGAMNSLQMLQMAANDKPAVRKLAFDLATTLRMANNLIMWGVPLVLLRAILYRLLDNRPYPAETVLDFARDPSGQLGMRVAAAAIGSGIPLVGDDIAGILGAQNVKSSIANLAESSLVGKSVKSLLDAATSYVKTGDTAGSALALQRTFAPALTPVVNRLPDVEARNAINDAVRVAKVNRGEIEVKERGGGQGAQPTEFSSLVNKAVAASAAGDMAGAMKYREQAIAVKTAAGDKDADGAFRAAVAARNPEFKAFGRRLTDSEREAVLGRMSEGQRAIYDRGEQAVSNLLRAIPKATRAVSGSGKGAPASGGIASINRKFRQMKSRMTPPALKAVKKKLSTMKPKKLSLGGVRTASALGSRLLRPRSLVRAGVGRLPGASRMPKAPSSALGRVTAARSIGASRGFAGLPRIPA